MPIAQSYTEARDQTERLVARFARNLDVYRRPAYKEAQVRAKVIDTYVTPFPSSQNSLPSCSESPSRGQVAHTVV